MSGIGLAGCHGVGKSTLANACVEAFGFKFVGSNATKVITEAGFNPASSYDFKTRLMLQELILNDAINHYEAARSEVFITDRTPLDHLTYLMTDIGRNNVDDDLAERLLDYTRRCFSVLNCYFNVVIVLQPGVVMLEREGKGAANLAYAEHYTSLINGLAVDPLLKVQHTFIPRRVVDLNQRVNAVRQSVEIAFASFERMAKMRGVHTQSTGSIH